MTKRFKDVGEVRSLWEQIKLAIDKPGGMPTNLIEAAVGYLAEKRISLTGQAYVDKMEENVLYLADGARQFLWALVRYLREGKPRVRGDQIQAFAFSLRGPALASTDHHLRYIRQGCSGCPDHGEHGRWEHLRRLRLTATPDDWLEELEFGCIYYQMKFIITNTFLQVFVANPQLACLAASLLPSDVFAALDERAELTVGLWGGLIKFPQPLRDGQGRLVGLQPVSPSQSPPRWREIWGKEFDTVCDRLQR